MNAEEALGLLISCTQPDESGSLKTAESNLAQAQMRDGFSPCMCRILLDEQFPVHYRQLAGLVLKNFVKKHWDPVRSSEPGVYTCSQEDKKECRLLIPNGLRDPKSRIRNAAGMAITRMAALDYPETWPDIMTILINGMQSNDTNVVHGCVKCLSMWCQDIADTQLPVVIPVLMPVLLNLLRNHGTPYRIRMRAVSIMTTVIQLLGMIQGASRNTALSILKPMLPAWYQVFAESLIPPRDVQSECGLQIAVLSCLSILCRHFSKIFKNHFNDFLVPIWGLLVSCAQLHETYFVRDSNLGEEIAQDSDGDAIGLSFLVAALFEFLQTAAEQPRLQPILVRSGNEALFKIILTLMQMTEDQIDTWESDPSQFATDEFDSTELFGDSRVMGQWLLQELITSDETLVLLGHFVNASKRMLEEANAARSVGDLHWWKKREAAFLGIGCIHDFLVLVQDIFPVAEFVRKYLLPDAEGKEENFPIFLQGRALWCASQFASHISDSLAVSLVLHAISSLLPEKPTVLRLCAAKAVSGLCTQVPDPLVMASLSTVVKHLSSMIGDPRVTEEALIIVLEALETVVGKNAEATRENLQDICSRLLNLWVLNQTDPLMFMDVIAVFDTMAKIEGCAAIMGPLLLPSIVDILRMGLNTPTESTGIAEHAMDLLTSILKLQFPGYMDAFPLVIAFGLSSSDVEILQSTGLLLGAYINVAGSELANSFVNVNDGMTGVEAIVLVLQRLLAPEVEESWSISVGPLILRLVTKIPQCLGEVLLRNIIRAMVMKLVSASSASLKRSLVLVIAYLIRTQIDFIVTMLNGMDLGGGRTALEAVLSVWVMEHKDLITPFDIKLSLNGLAMLFTSGNNTIMSMHVPDERIVANSSCRVVTTRSQSGGATQKWSHVPFPVKLVRLMCDELLVEEEYDSEDEWEDDEDDEGDREEMDSGDLVHLTDGSGRDVFLPAEGLLDESGNIDASRLSQMGFGADKFSGGDFGVSALEFSEEDIAGDPLAGGTQQEFVANFMTMFKESGSAAYAQLFTVLSNEHKAVLAKLGIH